MPRRGCLRLKADLLEQATRRSVDVLEEAFQRRSFEPYYPVVGQYFAFWRAVNRARKRAALPAVPYDAIRKACRIYQPFGDGTKSAVAA